MEISVVQGNIAEQAVDCIVVNLFEGVTRTGRRHRCGRQGAERRDQPADRRGDFTGKAGSTALLYTDGEICRTRVLVVGLGDGREVRYHRRRARQRRWPIKTLAKAKGVKHYATIVHGAGIGGLDPAAAARPWRKARCWPPIESPNYKREAPENGAEHCTVVEFDGSRVAALAAAVRRGAAHRRGRQPGTRPLQRAAQCALPGGVWRSRARQMAEQTGLRCTVLGEDEMGALDMNILLAVSRGSANEAQLIILEHAPAGTEEQAPLVFVGKGITFDTGGISIKPSERMEEMKHDMSGAAAVIGAMEAIAQAGRRRAA